MYGCGRSHLAIERRHAGRVDDAASVAVGVRLVLPHLADGQTNHVKGSCDINLQRKTRLTPLVWGHGTDTGLVFRTLMTRWKSSRLWGHSFLKLYVFTATAIPAQLTAKSSFPNLSLARDTAACTSASDVTWNHRGQAAFTPALNSG